MSPSAPPAPYRFHAFEVSYFSAKVRPALRYKLVGTGWEVVLAYRPRHRMAKHGYALAFES